MQLFRARSALRPLVLTMLGTLLVNNVAWGEEDVCRDSGLTGKGFGLCTAYCEAMDCDSESPNANETACGEVQSKFLETTGLAEMPCGAGTGEPPVASLECPCDFAVDSWRDLMTDGTYPYQDCQLNVGPGGIWDNLLLGLFDQEQGSGDRLDQLYLSTEISNEDDGIIKGMTQCSAVKYDANLSLEIYSPRPLGTVVLYHTFENERLPIQTGAHEACQQDLQALIDELFPELECGDGGHISDFDGDGVLAISDGGADCDDYDSRVYPGSAYWHDQAAASGGYDYNCDGQETKQYTALCSTSFENHCWYGSDAIIPECGVTAQQLVGECSPTFPGLCTLESVTQYCN